MFVLSAAFPNRKPLNDLLSTARTNRVATAALVPGDIVLLGAGDTIGFDGRLNGTAVVRGRGRAVVVATGQTTEVGVG